MSLQVLKIADAAQWDCVVRSFAQYDVYYLSGYAQAFQLHGDGEPLLFYYEGNGTRAINVVMKRDVADDVHFKGRLEAGRYFDFITPYGYGGFLLEGDGTSNLVEEYDEYCRQHGIICEFVRFHPILETYKSANGLGYCAQQIGNTITIDLSSYDLIWSNFTSRNRNMVRKAENNGIVINHGSSQNIIDQFKALYHQAMDRVSSSPYYYFADSFYASLFTDLTDNATIFYAEHQGEIVAASIMLYSNNFMHYHLSATATKHLNLAPTNLLLYKAACWGVAQGYCMMHLGGGLGGSTSDGLFSFKKSFNKQAPKDFHIGTKIFDESSYRELVAQRVAADIEFNQDVRFFPLYRA